MATTKPVHTIVLDTGAIIKNHPTVSTLLAQSENLVTVPAIISEIRDAATRSRVETTLLPFLTLRSPNPNSIKFVSDFARRTGDLAVLSKPDIQIIALAYELECERNGGDWRLRKVPGQKGLNGSPPAKADKPKDQEVKDETSEPQQVEEESVREVAEQTADAVTPAGGVPVNEAEPVEQIQEPVVEDDAAQNAQEPVVEDDAAQDAQEPTDANVDETADAMANTNLNAGLDGEKAEEAPEAAPEATLEAPVAGESQEDVEASSDDSDSEGWITPSNLKKHQAKDAGVSMTAPTQASTMQVGTLTTDFAMQNVILQINLNLLSPSMHRVKHLKTFILRCHACFQTTKQMDKQFCERCGKPTLTRVACSTDANGEFKLHLKKNMQWNTRGDKFSIPKAVHGSTNGRRNHGGGKGGWGTELILAEDQKEYMKAQTQQQRSKERDLMDEDYLPSILTGNRDKAGGRIRVGAGRNVNSRKR